MSRRLVAILCLGAACAGAPPPEQAIAPEGEVYLSDKQITASQLVLAPAENGPVPVTIRLAGRVTFDDQRVTHVFSPVTGRVTQIFVTPGETVKKGAALAEIDSPDVGNAMSDLFKAEADEVAARRELERQRDLYQIHAAPQKDLEVAEDNHARGAAELERTRQKMRLLHLNSAGHSVSQTFVLSSPISGEVISRALSPGMEVQGQYSGGNVAELFTIGDLDQVWVLADVHEMDVGRVTVGQPVSASVVAFPGLVFPGTVQWVSDVLDPVTHTVRVRVELPNLDRRLKPEMYSTLTVTVDSTPTVSVPRSALVRFGDLMVVYVKAGTLPDGRTRFVRRRVHTATELPSDGPVPVLDGVAKGDLVVSHGAILLSET